MPLIAPGNIDLHSRPIVKNPDGSYSTVRSMSFEQDGRTILVPTIDPQGNNLNPQQAIERFRKTGEHLGMFDNEIDATDYAKQLHNQQEMEYRKRALQQLQMPTPTPIPTPGNQ